MKTTTLAAALWLVALGSAQPFTVNWLEDSSTSFSITMSGTGTNDYDTGPIELTSPSGLWDFDMRQWFNHYDYNPNRIVMLQGGALLRGGALTFNPTGDLFRFDSYNGWTDIDVLAPQGGSLYGPVDWNGFGELTITCIPDLSDNSTWNWTSFYEAHGPSLATVPESGGILCLAFATGLLLFWRRKGLMA